MELNTSVFCRSMTMDAYIESMVTQMSSTQSTQRSLCSRGITPQVVKREKFKSFHPAYQADQQEQFTITKKLINRWTPINQMGSYLTLTSKHKCTLRIALVKNIGGTLGYKDTKMDLFHCNILFCCKSMLLSALLESNDF